MEFEMYVIINWIEYSGLAWVVLLTNFQKLVNDEGNNLFDSNSWTRRHHHINFNCTIHVCFKEELFFKPMPMGYRPVNQASGHVLSTVLAKFWQLISMVKGISKYIFSIITACHVTNRPRKWWITYNMVFFCRKWCYFNVFTGIMATSLSWNDLVVSSYQLLSEV